MDRNNGTLMMMMMMMEVKKERFKKQIYKLAKY